MGFFPQFPGFGGNRNQNITVRKGADVGGLLGGTPMDDGQAISLGILQAMPQLQQAGYERSASPAGSIAKNLMPLFGAMIYAQAAQQQAAAQQQQQGLANRSTEADIGYKEALTQKAMSGSPEGGAKNLQQLLAQRLQAGQPIDDIVGAIKQTQKPASSEWGARMEVAGGDPALALQQKDAADRSHAQMMGQAAEALRQQKATADEARRLAKPAETGGLHAYDPLSGNRISNARQADLDNQTAITLSGNEQKAWANAKDAWRQTEALKKLVPELLPDKGGILSTPSTLAKESYGVRTGDKRWALFDQMASFLKFPILQATVRGRPPLSESKTIREVNAHDTQDSAMAKINEFQAQILGLGDALGFHPDALSQTAYPLPTNESAKPAGNSGGAKSTSIPNDLDVEVPAKYSAGAMKIFNDVAAQHGATAGAIAVQSWLKTQAP